MKRARNDLGIVPKCLRKGADAVVSHMSEVCRCDVVALVNVMPKTRKVIHSTSATHNKDFIDPRIENTIIRSSRKNFMIRITLATRKTRRTRITRSTETLPQVFSKFSVWLAAVAAAVAINSKINSNRLKETTVTSITFHHLSSSWKNCKRPSQNQRRANSTVKTVQKSTCNTTKCTGVVASCSMPRSASLCACTAASSVCQARKMQFSRMRTPLHHS
mmetsp:Transcript_132713/g.370031  ORF Transcript_132713/g.370031 Transcript_132713/m.370031 type:complete len:218 (+) Transcript_132713:433-1086(+)